MCAGEGEESGDLRRQERNGGRRSVEASERKSRTEQQFVSYGEKTGWSARRSPITCQIHARCTHPSVGMAGRMVAHQNEVKLLVWSVCPHNVLGSRTGLLWNSSLGNRAPPPFDPSRCVQVVCVRQGKVAYQSQRKKRRRWEQVKGSLLTSARSSVSILGHRMCAARQGGAMPSVGDACCTQRSPSLWPFDQSGDKNIVCRYHRVAAPARRVLSSERGREERGGEEGKLD
jgi:hypothetical protein